MFDPIEKLKEYIRCQSVSTDSNFKQGMADARDVAVGMFDEMGLSVEIVDTPLHPIVVAKRDGNEDWPHVIIYGHYDVQPADPLELWETEPFEPTVKGNRIYGRGTADNKGPQLAHIAAVGQLLEEYPDLPLRITFIVEGEEEIGSPNLLPYLEANKEEFSKADFVFLSDTLSPSEEQIVVTVGLRGIIALEIELEGPKGDLHSGLHGGAVYNTAQALCEVCASLHTPDNKVNVPGFYDDVVGVEDWEREELQALGPDEEAYKKLVGMDRFHTHPGYTPFEATRYLPTLEFNGIWSGYQGEGSKTIVPSKAYAKITCRLVANQDPLKIGGLVKEAILERIPKGIKAKVEYGHEGVPYLVVPPDRPNTPEDQPELLAKCFRATDEAVAEVFGRRPLFLREGGSIPIIADIKRVLGLDSVMIGLFLPEDNLHAPNESMNLDVLTKGIEASKRVLKTMAGV
ncbi:MAG: M20/M25/M40 family metallo-hydrolase [Verrucomicrobiota bacterium]